MPRNDVPGMGEYNFTADTQSKDGNTWHLRGRVVLEGALMILKADEVDLNEETHDAEARGHVYFQHFERNEILVCARAEYNTESEYGKFYEVKGYTKTKINAHPGVLTSDNPFYFEGKWAERLQDKYILHNGFITGCELPTPWWTLNGPKFDIIPEDRALAYKAVYRLKKVPLFYFPIFYKSLKKEPRQSGFLTPNFGNSSTRGIMLGLGYYWAINRSYDVLYHVQDFTSRGLAHHIDFRGKPTDKSDFDAIFYGVQDREHQGGIDLYMTGHADLGNGWMARGNVNYLSSLLFRQSFSESYNEAVFSESASVGYLSKHFDSYTFNTVVSRLENFQDVTQEQLRADPQTAGGTVRQPRPPAAGGPVSVVGLFRFKRGPALPPRTRCGISERSGNRHVCGADPAVLPPPDRRPGRGDGVPLGRLPSGAQFYAA